MSKTRVVFMSLVPRGAVIALALALLSGCNESELRSRVSSVESRLNAVPEKPSLATQLPPNAVPIRYSVSPIEAQSKAVQEALQHLSLTVPPPFMARREKNGKIGLSGVGDFGETGAKWLRDHGFVSDSKRPVKQNTAWVRELNSDQLSELERLIPDALLTANESIEIDHTHTRYENCGMKRYNSVDKHHAAHAVSTGNGLDFTFSDDPSQPEFFVNLSLSRKFGSKPTGKTSDELTKETDILIRGGRIIVRGDDLYLEGSVTPLTPEKSVPKTATHLALSTDGMITAYDASGHGTDLGRIQIVRVKSLKKVEGGIQITDTASIEEWVGEHGRGPFLPGCLEMEDNDPIITDLAHSIRWRNGLLALQAGLISLATKPSDGRTESDLLPLIVHTPLPKTVEHLRALKIAAEKTNERTTIGQDADEENVENALVTVLQGLRRRLAIHEENLRNAGKTRDPEGRLNAYRRKTVAIGPQGNIIEGVDKSDLPKNYKPGDPDAGPDGFVVLSNVNKAVETEEFKGTIEEYKLIRAALERLAPKHIFPDPPSIP